MQTALVLRFRIEEPYVLMAWRPFGIGAAIYERLGGEYAE
jgi:hypothetical protein